MIFPLSAHGFQGFSFDQQRKPQKIKSFYYCTLNSRHLHPSFYEVYTYN